MSLAVDDIPERVEGLDTKSLPLSAVEGFVLSRVDGTSTAKVIADATGIGEDIALSALQRLVTLGALTMRPASTTASEPRPERTANKRFEKPAAQRIRTIPPPAGTPRRLYDPAELEEDVALDDNRKRRVLDVFYKLGSADHYELLEVGRDATKEEIRESYFALSKEFHPDTAFGKDLGTYKGKMEKIFTAATGAYDVLSRKARRAQYDATLPPASPDDLTWRERRRGRAASRAQVAAANSPTSATTTSESKPTSERPVPPAPAPPAPPARSAPPPARSAPPTPPAPPSTPAPSSSVPPTADQVKRSKELLKMRLMGGRGGLSSVTGSDHPNPARRPPAAATTSTELSRAEALRGLAGTLKDVSSVTGSRQTLRRHLLAASDAERAGDLKTGLNAARLANALAPDDLEVQEVLGRLERARSVEEAPMFEKRALAEEKAGQWSQAALSWLRVVQGRPQDPVSARHCANALLEANLDLKTARDLAVRAMEADPSLVASRTLLARIYVAAGMHSNARRELDAATKLDPGNEIVKNLLRELG